MQTIRVSVDHRVGVEDLGTEYETNDVKRVVDDVNRLDGAARTIVAIQRGNVSLTIGGGNDGRYVAFVAVNQDEEFFNLVNRDVPEGKDEVQVVTGGQAGLFSRRACLEKSTVIEAASHFAETGAMNRTLCWDKA